MIRKALVMSSSMRLLRRRVILRCASWWRRGKEIRWSSIIHSGTLCRNFTIRCMRANARWQPRLALRWNRRKIRQGGWIIGLVSRQWRSFWNYTRSILNKNSSFWSPRNSTKTKGQTKEIFWLESTLLVIWTRSTMERDKLPRLLSLSSPKSKDSRLSVILWHQR